MYEGKYQHRFVCIYIFIAIPKPKTIHIPSISIPGEQCGPNTLVIMADQCEYIDQQTLKLQESPEAVPTGEMPRHIMLSVDR
ncbi:hypothetical protein EON65_12190 [archaeon]|nr:MAG: hypothetical protein EON65_12190 [archaeon]